ncbi:MAG: lipopolysaccharide transport periplasmic protein LptA [Gammaproteobacteria bacterium]|nr:lipopolysaccharide transport periplasmic protein LptA [Gammaproteobacteria bacterium]
MIKKLKLLCFLLFFSSPIWALETDNDQPIDISADSLNIDEAKHISIYKGNVILQQGSLNINADTLVLYFNEQNELDYMEASGSPVHFKQKNEDQKWMTGLAKSMIYYDQQSELTLKKDAEFNTGNEHIKSHYIQVNTNNNSLQAGASSASDRVIIKIMPKNKAKK